MGKLKDHLENVVNRTWNGAGRCATEQDEIMNAVLGIGGEAGEIVDIHKKMLFHRVKDGYRQELMLELGDLYYYLIKLQDLYGFTLKEILAANKDKLYKRYGVTGA